MNTIFEIKNLTFKRIRISDLDEDKDLLELRQKNEYEALHKGVIKLVSTYHYFDKKFIADEIVQFFALKDITNVKANPTRHYFGPFLTPGDALYWQELHKRNKTRSL